MRLLLIEDDPDLNRGLSKDLSQRGFAVDSSLEGVDGAFMGEHEPYDIIVLDLGLPDLPGLGILEKWRSKGIKTPVLILTARGAWHEKVEGFRKGADDYLTKPFHIEELTVRLESLVKRSNGFGGSELRIGRLRLDEARQFAQWKEPDRWRDIELTGIEFRLLRYLMLHPKKVCSISHLLEHVYDFNEEKESNVIEVYISRLRRKINKDVVLTRRGQGYYLNPSQL
ncbi:MAG: response regulator transcription factor [Mariprofundaceae bacterium]|nr:response regulator transcription factor [Mariprofundaceae bacterium]